VLWYLWYETKSQLSNSVHFIMCVCVCVCVTDEPIISSSSLLAANKHDEHQKEWWKILKSITSHVIHQSVFQPSIMSCNIPQERHSMTINSIVARKITLERSVLIKISVYFDWTCSSIFNVGLNNLSWMKFYHSHHLNYYFSRTN